MTQTGLAPLNTRRQLSFAGPYVDAELVENVADLHVDGRTIVVNPTPSTVLLAERPRKGIPPMSSTILVDVAIEAADRLILLRVPDREPISGIVTSPGWDRYGDLVAGAPALPGVPPFPPEIPLWRSPQDEAGYVGFDPAVLRGQPVADPVPQRFKILTNLWYAPAGTDCFIHNQHQFVEIHTQVAGLGRMQKFRRHDKATLYEDLLMSPGYTTPDPFCLPAGNFTFEYPWHQYYADTDAVWLAVEYHLDAPSIE